MGSLSDIPLCPVSNAPGKDQHLPRPSASDCFKRLKPELVKIYDTVRGWGVPNYRGARVGLHSGINTGIWRDRAHMYGDSSLADMLDFGFPSGHLGDTNPAVGLSNHSSAIRNPLQVDKFLAKEGKLGALVGPFSTKPFEPWCRTNPLMTRPKRESSDLRVILDLSFPRGESVNSHIRKECLDGAPFKLQLPRPSDLARQMRTLGRDCKLYKVDLSRAYRQLRGDPLDWPLLGIMWGDEFFVDLAIPFGLRHGASACQRVSVALGKISAYLYTTLTMAYIDDTAGVAMGEVADLHYNKILETFAEMGLEVAPGKCESPSHVMTWIGVVFNAREMTMAIDPARIAEAVEACHEFIRSERITLHKLQQFVGRLFHAIKCTDSARAFMARILDLLRLAAREQVVAVSSEARQDALWCTAFLEAFNGVTVAKPQVAEVVASVDSCLVGGGGYCEGYGFYAIKYPEYLTDCGFSISSLECLNVLFALRLWAPAWSGKHVLIFCDNAATVSAANSCRAEDPLIRAVLREFWWLSAVWDVQLAIRHKPGKEMETADLLSRAYLSPNHHRRFEEFCRDSSECRLNVNSGFLSPPLHL